MRLKVSTLLLGPLSIFSILLVFKASNEPILSIFSGTWVDSFFKQFDTGNSIIFGLSIGFLVSVFFYILVVWFPNRQRKNLIKHNFKEQYRLFKCDTISILLGACQSSYDGGLPRKLSEQSEFVKFFQEPVGSDSRNIRWYNVLNGLKEHHLKELLVVMEIFMNEIAYVLNNVNINEPEAFAFFKRLSQAVYQLKNSTLDCDEIKSLTNFIWEIFAGFSLIDGLRDYDIIKIMINKI